VHPEAGTASGALMRARELAAFLPDCAVLMKRLLRDPRVPRRAKLALWLLLPYLASPIDLIPGSEHGLRAVLALS
jgi:uncharacterized membrane protein YkvA (DUF1232 family)